MNTSTIAPVTTLPKNLPLDGAIDITLQDGVMIFRASENIQERIENLLENRAETPLTEIEEQELNDFAVIDDYLGLVNRMIRNHFLVPSSSSLSKDWLSEEENEAWKDL